MTSPVTTMTPMSNLATQLQQIGLRVLPANLDDFLARATKARWSPHVLLEQLAQAEAEERSRRSLEQRLRVSGIKSFKPMVDYEWTWPTKIERDVIERALTLDFLPEARNLVLVGRNGLGKTMIAQNICHAAVLTKLPTYSTKSSTAATNASRSSSPPTVPSKSGTRSFPMLPASPRFSIVFYITPM
jgi:DNA replication protein DnaC